MKVTDKENDILEFPSPLNERFVKLLVTSKFCMYGETAYKNRQFVCASVVENAVCIQS